MNNFNSKRTFIAIGCGRHGAGMSINNIIMLLKYGTFGARAQIALDQFLEVDAIMKFFCLRVPVNVLSNASNVSSDKAISFAGHV